MKIKFGPAGTNLAFSINKKNKMMMFPAYLAQSKLNALEYQCGHGIRISAEAAKLFGEECKKNSIFLSIHSPYYISLSSTDAKKRENSVNYILQTAILAKAMDAKRIIIHSGSCAKISRPEALNLAKQTLADSLYALKNNNLSDIILCPEVMGKINQLGTLQEVIDLCKIQENILPCIDFGHLNARSFGTLNTLDDYKFIFFEIANSLGEYRLKNMHIHFSKIEYTKPGGEKRHLTFSDKTYGPQFEPLANLLVQKSATPVIICESAGTQVEDAITMQAIYQETLQKNNNQF